MAKEKFLADHASALALTAETVAIENKEAVAAAAVAFAALDSAVQATLVTEGELLLSLTAKIAELEAAEALAAAQLAAKDALSALDTSSYRAAQVAELEAIVEAQGALIDACTTPEAVLAQVELAKEAIAAVKTNAQLFAEEYGDLATTVQVNKLNEDVSEGNAIAIFTKSGQKIREVIDPATGAYNWVGLAAGNAWRYFVVVDAEGRIAYAVNFPDSGYGGPYESSYYHDPYYSDPDANPALNVLEGWEAWQDNTSWKHNLFEVIIPEGGFAIVSHGTGTATVGALVTDGAITNPEEDKNADGLIRINVEQPYNPNLRFAYDSVNKTFVAYDILPKAKAEAVAALTVDPVDYYQTALAQLQAGLVTYTEAFNAATSLTELNQKVEEAKAALAAVPTKVQELQAAYGEDLFTTSAAKLNEDVSDGNAIAIFTQPGYKLREVADVTTGASTGVITLWRTVIVVDSEGRICYAVTYSETGYGGPKSASYQHDPFYASWENNPAIVMLEGYEDWVDNTSWKHNLYEIVIPEGGFALVSHGTGSDALLTKLTDGVVTVEDQKNDDGWTLAANNTGVYNTSYRLAVNTTAKTVAVYADDTVVASVVNADAGADAIGAWTEAGAKLKTVSDAATGATSWVGNGWRYYVVVDKDGKIAYSVCMPPNGYGGPNGNGYYCHPSYADYTQNPAINALEGFGPYVSGGFAHNLYEVVVPEGGFALTAHGSGINALVDLFSQGEIAYSGDATLPVINAKNAYSENLRVHYNAETKEISVSMVVVE